jgi:hypothetical protein
MDDRLDLSALTGVERRLLRAHRQLVAAGNADPTIDELARVAQLADSNARKGVQLLRAAGLIPPTVRATQGDDPDPSADECAAIERRAEVVRQAKIAQAFCGGPPMPTPGLTLDQLGADALDVILPPVECRRLRLRLAKGRAAR